MQQQQQQRKPVGGLVLAHKLIKMPTLAPLPPDSVLDAPLCLISPSSPSHDTTQRTQQHHPVTATAPPSTPPLTPSPPRGKTLKWPRKRTLEDLMEDIIEAPQRYMGPESRSLNPHDLCNILTAENVTVIPSKRFCRLLLETLVAQGDLQSSH